MCVTIKQVECQLLLLFGFILNLCVGGIKLAVVDFMVKIYIFFLHIGRISYRLVLYKKKIHYLSECEWMIKPKQMKMKRNNPM